MDYDNLVKELTDLSNIINDCRKGNIINNDLIYNIIKHTHSHIPENLKRSLIENNAFVFSCMKIINRRIDRYIVKIEYDKIITKLKGKLDDFADDDTLKNTYKSVLDYMIKSNIIKNMTSVFIQNTSDVNTQVIEEDENEEEIETETIDEECEDLPSGNFEWRENQIKAIERLNKNGIETGIYNSATGTGKSYIILKIIDYIRKNIGKYNNRCRIILFTERVSILRDLFELNNSGRLNDKIKYWKENDICDLTKFAIINRVTEEGKNWYDEFVSAKYTLLLINRAYLSLCENTYIKLNNNTSLVIHDECHNATSPNCLKILQHFKKNNVNISGFSATPVRTGAKQLAKILPIYGDGKEINIIIDYGLIYSINKNLIVPPIFNWFQFEDFADENKMNVTDNEVDYILTSLSEKIDEMPYKKLIAWCGYIELTKSWINKILKNYKKFPKLSKFKFFIDIDYKIQNVDGYSEFRAVEKNAIMFCAKKHREGSDIHNLDGCIFLDKARDREAIPFIQSIGRVLRKNTNKKMVIFLMVLNVMITAIWLIKSLIIIKQFKILKILLIYQKVKTMNELII